MFFGINGGEALVLLLLAVIVIGPERLPRYAEQLGGLVRRARDLLGEAKARVDSELGPEMKDIDWSKLDPRQYDPRRIVRDALLEPPPSAGSSTPRVSAASTDGPAPFDDEAT